MTPGKQKEYRLKPWMRDPLAVAHRRNVIARLARVQADGGVQLDTLRDLVAAGADVLVFGSGLFNDKPVAENVRRLKELMH